MGAAWTTGALSSRRARPHGDRAGPAHRHSASWRIAISSSHGSLERSNRRSTGLFGIALTLVPLVFGWQFAHTAAHFYALGFLLGIAGASFAVALPLACRWYPPEYQGLAMGIAGAGNSGTLLATLFAPRLADRFGWAATFGLAIAPLVVVLVIFALLAKDSPARRVATSRRDYAAVLRQPDTLWLSFLYSLTFGTAKDLTGSYSSGLFSLALAFMVGTVVLLELGARWSGCWSRAAVDQAGVFSYRAVSRNTADDVAG